MADIARRSLITREKVGWVLYDWANSAFVLCVITVIGSAYFVELFRSAARQAGDLLVGDQPAMAVLGMVLPAASVWSFIVGGSALVVALSSPFLGAIADAAGARKKFLQTYCLIGVLATLALWFGLPWWAVGLLILAGNIAFEGGNVFYNAFLPDIASPAEQDMVSSAGYAAGYVGGVLVLIISLFVFILPSRDVHTPFLLIGLWWGGFALVAFALLREQPGRTSPRSGGNLTSEAWRELKTTARNVRNYPQAALFLVAFLLYNYGVMTIITNATPFALDNIYVDRSLSAKVEMTHLIPAIIIVQLIAVPGSFFCAWLATRFGEKPAIYFTLVVFTAVVAYGQVIEILSEFYVMAMLIGVVLGGVQAISRSVFASLIPRGKNAEFFAFFALSGKFSAVVGPFIYGLSVWLAGSTRIALLSLVIFFVLGGAILYFVDLAAGREQALAAGNGATLDGKR